ncbi:MAG: SprT family zinc-dependent metalloprotease [Patescibacteria group bacterium]
MPSKEFILDDLVVTVYKRRTSRNLRLSIAPNGKVRVSIPAWAPYGAGVKFAKSRAAWIREQQTAVKVLADGQAIGKAHHLQFVPKPGVIKVTSRVYDTTVTVTFPNTMDTASSAVQKVAVEASIRALRAQSEQLLPQRLASLAEVHGFKYKSIAVKRLKSRWGSCDHETNIVLNLFLMQLPWELIDYVLMHELTHTNILRHGKDFWDEMAKVLPNTPALKKELRHHQPILNGFGQNDESVA